MKWSLTRTKWATIFAALVFFVIIELLTELVSRSILVDGVRWLIYIVLFLIVLTLANLAFSIFERDQTEKDTYVRELEYRRKLEEEANDEITAINEMVNRQLEELMRMADRLKDAYVGTINMLAIALDERDSYTHGHSDRVRRWALAVGKQMGLEGRELEDLATGAILHDIGKIGIEDNILRKPGPLSSDERAKIETHPVRGEQIIAPVKELHPIIPIVRNHHERPDGHGYPSKLKDIPLAARIVAVVDAYDAMVSERPYRPAMEAEDARHILREVSGTQLDAEIVQVFLQHLYEEEADGRPEPR